MFLNSWRQQFSQAKDTVGIDYYHYWISGEIFRRGITDSIYTHEGRDKLAATFIEEAQESDSRRFRFAANWNKKISTTGTPFFYAFFKFLTSNHYDRDFLVFNLISILAYFSALALLLWYTKLTVVESCCLILLSCLMFLPMILDIVVMNCNRILLFLSCSAFMCLTISNRKIGYFSLGAILAAATLFNPVFAISGLFVGLHLLLKKRWQALACYSVGSFVASHIAIGWSITIFGEPSVWQDWYRILPKDLSSDFYADGLMRGNVSLNYYFYTLTGQDLKLPLLVVLTSGFIVFLFTRDGSERTSNELAICLGSLAYLTISPLVWNHYLVLLLPASVLLYARAREPVKGRLLYSVLAVFPFLYWQWLAPFLPLQTSYFLPAILFASVLCVYWFAIEEKDTIDVAGVN